MSTSQETPGESFSPDENYLSVLLSMGISREIAEEALFCTENKSLELAAEYALQKPAPSSYIDKSIKDSGDSKKAKTELENSDDYETEEEIEMDYYKMVFVVNMSLKMGVGKVAAQVGHATLGLYKKLLARRQYQEGLNKWELYGQKKIVLKGIDTNQLIELKEKAKTANMPACIIRDAGRTQIAPNSVTVLSLFGMESEVDQITGKLSLL